MVGEEGTGWSSLEEEEVGLDQRGSYSSGVSLDYGSQVVEGQSSWEEGRGLVVGIHLISEV